MRRTRHLMLTLAPGEAPHHVPCALDHLIGAGRPATTIDGGPIDLALRRGGGFRALSVYSARASLGRAGEQHLRYSDAEEDLGLSRTYQVEIAHPDAARAVIDRLRRAREVQSAHVETVSSVPFAADSSAAAPAAGPTDAAWTPHERIHAPHAHAIEPGDERVTVGLVDTGISIGHPELQRKLLAGYDTVDLGLDEAAGLHLVGDSRGDDFTPEDEVGHGSHVGGIVGATGWELPPGVAGRSLLLPIRVLAAALTKDGSHPVGIGAEANINAGFKVAVDLGADVLNLSFGTSEHDIDPDGPKPQEAVVAYAQRNGCALIAASGNSGVAERYFPAALEHVIAVASVDAEERRSTFSSSGDHVALSAPGENIVSAGITGLRSGSGTSYAAPFVTGTTALLVAHARRAGRELAPPEIRDLLTASATPLGQPAAEVGAGLLNAEAALRRLDEGERDERSAQ